MINDEQVYDELDIHPESFTSLEKDLMNHAKLTYKYNKAAAVAQKNVDILTFELELLTGDILQDILSKRKVPPSAISEVRRTEVPLDERYVEKRMELINATETLNTLLGAVRAMDSRSYRLGDLTELKKKLLKDDYVVLEDDVIRANLNSIKGE